MKVFLDKQELSVGFGQDSAAAPSAGALGEALDEARRTAQALGRVIVEVKLDGRALSTEEIDAGERGVAIDPPPQRLEFITADPRELVATSMAQAADALEEARDAQTSAAELLASGDVGGALEQIGEVVGVWEAVRVVLEQGPGLLGVPLARFAHGREGGSVELDRHTRELSACLQNFKSALTAEDWSTLGDLLAEDMDVQARVWSELLRTLASGALAV